MCEDRTVPQYAECRPPRKFVGVAKVLDTLCEKRLLDVARRCFPTLIDRNLLHLRNAKNRGSEFRKQRTEVRVGVSSKSGRVSCPLLVLSLAPYSRGKPNCDDAFKVFTTDKETRVNVASSECLRFSGAPCSGTLWRLKEDICGGLCVAM